MITKMPDAFMRRLLCLFKICKNIYVACCVASNGKLFINKSKVQFQIDLHPQLVSIYNALLLNLHLLS